MYRRRRNSELFARHVTGAAILAHNLNDGFVFRVESGAACKMNDVEVAAGKPPQGSCIQLAHPRAKAPRPSVRAVGRWQMSGP